MSTERLKPWGSAYQERTRRAGTSDADCLVCGKRVKEPVELYAVASPVTGDFCAMDAAEASLYPIGPECEKKVRRLRPDAIITTGPTEADVVKPRLKLIGEDGNAFSILGRAARAARQAGWPQERIDEYSREAKSGDYDHLIQTTMRYFETF